MGQPFQNFIFTPHEQPRLRNWLYTTALAIFVPTGFRFAILAWEYGEWFDKPLSIFAGIFIGVSAVVTLLRIWTVPPRQTLASQRRSANRGKRGFAAHRFGGFHRGQATLVDRVSQIQSRLFPLVNQTGLAWTE